MQRKPRVALNAHLLNLRGNYRSAGINWYIYHLLKNLETIPNFDYTVFLSDPNAHAQFQRLQLVQSRLPTHSPIVRILWEQLIQPAALRTSCADLLHALAFAGPRTINIPWIVTIYDLSFMKFPHSFNFANRTYLTYAVRDSLRRADRAIAISESTKHDLVTYFGVHPDKVRVIHCGIDPALTLDTDTQQLRAKYSLPDTFILHLGTIEPRKNIVRLISAFALAKRKAKLPHHLVLVGAYGWSAVLRAEIDRAVTEAGVADAVRFIGYAPQAEVASWYRAADLFAYPSLYEGFGLPPLEAMACGTPVVTSNVSSLPEVVGNAGLMVAPEDERALTDAIIRAVTDRALHAAMSARGLEQAKQFSWARVARETAELYREVLNAKG